MFALVALLAGWDARMRAAPDSADSQQTASHEASAGTHWWQAVWGRTPSAGVYYLPIGFHHNSFRPQPFNLTGGIYKGVYGMTFANSYDGRTWSVGVERDVYRFRRLTFAWGAGLMYGYHGVLVNSPKLPLRHTFLFEHAINPVLGLPVRLQLSRHLQVKGFATPVVSLVGLEIGFN